MEYEFTVKYSKEIISRAHLKFWKKNHSFDSVLFLTLLAASSYLLFIKGITEWYVVVFFTIALIFTIAVYSLYFIWRRASFAALNAMKIPEARWKLTQKSLYIESDAAKMELPWTTFKKIWIFKEIWLLFYGNGAFSTLPLDGLDSKALEFIKDRVLKNEGKVWNFSK